MCTLDGPSVLIAGGLVLGASRPRLHNVPRHAWAWRPQVQNIFCFSSFFGCVVKKFDQSVFLEAIIKAKTFAQKRLRGDAGCLSCS